MIRSTSRPSSSTKSRPSSTTSVSKKGTPKQSPRLLKTKLTDVKDETDESRKLALCGIPPSPPINPTKGFLVDDCSRFSKGFLPVGLQEQLDRRHEERSASKVRLPRIPSNAVSSDGETSERQRAVALEIACRKRARSMPRKRDKTNDDDKCYRQMFDKNTLRLRSRQLFMDALLHRPEIGTVFHETGEAEVKVLVRKRPMFVKELEVDFDVIRTSSTSCMISNSLFQADLKVPFFVHTQFHFDRAFDETASNLDVYRDTREA